MCPVKESGEHREAVVHGRVSSEIYPERGATTPLISPGVVCTYICKGMFQCHTTQGCNLHHCHPNNRKHPESPCHTLCPSLAFPQDSGQVKRGGKERKYKERPDKKGSNRGGKRRKNYCQERQDSLREKENILGSFGASLCQAACMILQCALPDNTCNLEWLLSGSPRRNRKFKSLET